MSFYGLIFLAALFQIAFVHPVKEIDGPNEKIQGFVHQAKYISIPFQKCFQVEPEIEANKKYISFKPTSLGLKRLKESSLKYSLLNIGTLEQIRNPASFKHKNILIFTDYIMVFSAPNRILIIRESESGFTISHSYIIDNLPVSSPFKIYKLGNQGFLTVYNSKKVFILNEKDYNDYSFETESSITHFEQIKGKKGEFFATELAKGLIHYKIEPNSKIIALETFGSKQLGLGENKSVYTMDFTLNYYESHKAIYILDIHGGVIELSFKNEKAATAKQIIAQKFCESFDSFEIEHFVLLCQSQGQSIIIQANLQQDKKTKQKYYKKLEPIFHATYLNDLHVAQKFYMVYSNRNIQVFWNTKKNLLPQTLNTQTQITLNGLESFTLQKEGSQTYLYSVESGSLNRYSLKQEKPSLIVRSDEPIFKTFTLYLIGSCSDISQSIPSQIQTCKIKKSISLQISEQVYARQQDFSISASIVVILIMVFLLVIWICLKKYKGLENEARKVLQNYKKKKNKQIRSI